MIPRSSDARRVNNADLSADGFALHTCGEKLIIAGGKAWLFADEII